MTARAAAQMAAQSVWRHQQQPVRHPLVKQWITEYAVAPEVVNWPKLHVTHTERWFRKLLVNVLTFFLVFFWMIPVVFASGLANLQVRMFFL